MFPRRKTFNPRRRNQGVTLIEVMISVLVMGIGMLGIAAMQATALRNSQSALERSQAVIQSYSILDAMRANVAIARTGGYNMAMSCAPPTGSSLVASDQANWINSLQGTGGIGASSCGAISCNTTTCTVTVRWDDSRASGGSATQSFVTVTRL
jgi:type IV pilus assembly protein PilV